MGSVDFVSNSRQAVFVGDVLDHDCRSSVQKDVLVTDFVDIVLWRLGQSLLLEIQLGVVETEHVELGLRLIGGVAVVK